MATTGDIFYLYNFAYIGTALGSGLGLRAASQAEEIVGRRLAQFLVGAYMLVSSDYMGGEYAMEGFFFYILPVFCRFGHHYL